MSASIRFCDILDNLVLKIGRTMSWLNGILLVSIITNIALRYAFSKGLVVFDELQWHLYSVNVMLGISYAYTKDSHIRLDILSKKFSQRKKETMEIFGILFFILPVVFITFIHGLSFGYNAWEINESSVAPMGLCCRWIIKSLIPIGFGLLGVASVSRLVRSSIYLVKGS